MYGYIYKTTNLVNGKIYIGQKKSKTFLGNAYLGSGKYLKCAIKHYGAENFSVELLDYSLSKEGLDILEKSYIEKYNSTNYDIGYNITTGASGGDTFSNLSDADKLTRVQKQKSTLKSKHYTHILIHKGDITKRIQLQQWDKYKLDGWERGRSVKLQEQLNASHKGLKQSDEWVQKRVKSGWKDKSPEEYAKMIEKHRIAAKRQMQNTPKEVRVKRAKNANKFTGHKCKFVHKGTEIKFIYESDLQTYLDMGYELGMKDRKVKDNDTQQK